MGGSMAERDYRTFSRNLRQLCLGVGIFCSSWLRR